MNGLYLIFCLAMIVFLAFAALLVISIRPGNKQDMENRANQPLKSTIKSNEWQSWLVFISISLVIAMWTVLGAFFFLVIVWLLRQNPGPHSSSTVSDKEKKSARGIYAWLLFSPILTIPVFIVMLYSSAFEASSSDGRILSSMIPLIVHIPLLSGMFSRNIFLFRHTQQGILLVALRLFMATLASDLFVSRPEYGIWLFLLGNGSLWLFGSTWGWNQIARGKYWWMKQNREKFASEAGNTAPQRMDRDLEGLILSLNARDQVITRTRALRAFQAGTPETKKRAVEVLSKLGEVETF